MLMVMMPLMANAYDAEIDGIYYNFSGSKAIVTNRNGRYNSYSGAVTIPESVSYNGNTYNVTDISGSAFAYCYDLTSITIPNSLTSIGERAFTRCISLQSATIPSSVTEIGERAFEDCESLTSAVIPDGVKTISDRSFFGCTSLSSLTIGNGVTSIGMSAFAGCRLTSLVFPNSVTSIGAFAFANCSDITSVTFPNSLTSIGSQAFEGCAKLTSLTIPNSVNSIAYDAFFCCRGLTSLVIDNGNTTYDSRDNCNAIIETGSNTLIWGNMNTIIPNSVTSIGNCAFQVCEGLTSVNIPEGVTTIGEGAFARCSNLKTVSVPKSVTYIGSCSFMDCSGLTDFYCYAENVPKTEYDTFGEVPTTYFNYKLPHESATLHVPSGSIEKYKTIWPWNAFGNIVPIAYYPEGTKWTEIRLDTLKYDSWYSKVGDEWVPNFETVEYYVQGEYKYRDWVYKKVYTNGPEWTDSLTLMLWEGEYDGDSNCVLATVPLSNREDGTTRALWPAKSYKFDWSVGEGLYYQDLTQEQMTGIVSYRFYYGVIDEIQEGYFGGVRPLKYVDLDGKAPANEGSIKNINTNGGRIIQGIGITDWNSGECLFGPPNPYRALYGWNPERHYRSMLVHFERNGEVLYDVWPAKETVSYTKNQMATIILPTEPDASKGKYYELDRCEEGKIIFTEEREPKARTPYIIIPNEDFTIDLSKLDLESLLNDTVSVKGAMFIGSYNSAEMNCQEGFYIDIIDSTPDCQIINADQRKAAVGALRAYLVAPWDDPYAQGGSRGVTEKREIVLLDNPNGIESIHNSQFIIHNDDAIYDLQGRRLSGKPAKGLYIQNGVKRVIK